MTTTSRDGGEVLEAGGVMLRGTPIGTYFAPFGERDLLAFVVLAIENLRGDASRFELTAPLLRRLPSQRKREALGSFGLIAEAAAALVLAAQHEPTRRVLRERIEVLTDAGIDAVQDLLASSKFAALAGEVCEAERMRRVGQSSAWEIVRLGPNRFEVSTRLRRLDVQA